MPGVNESRVAVHISLHARKTGGGANSFASNFCRWLRRNKRHYSLQRNMLKADRAIIIADKSDLSEAEKARANGCKIIHRIDEYFEKNESAYRRSKHAKIIELNKLAYCTVYQSRYVFNNVHPHLNPKRYAVIINGADPKQFSPSREEGSYIGHVSWSSDARKRFDILSEFVQDNPEEKFLLIGNHHKTGLPFDDRNVAVKVGPVRRSRIAGYYRKMKVLLLPSEKDPCPNTAIESILCGVPVCYNPDAGTREIVRDCGEPLERFRQLVSNAPAYRKRCLARDDLHFDNVARRYMSLI